MIPALATALDELRAVAKATDPAGIDAACAEIAAARQIVLYGCGREGLMMRALAMRLHHLGLSVAMQGDMTTPPLGPGDLFLCAAGPGELATVTALIHVAQAAGAGVLMVTAEPNSPTARNVETLLVIPAQTMARDATQPSSLLPMGSLFEGAMFLIFEVMVLDLARRLDTSPQEMRARHTNME
jgi:6-phospho-3-hexuloisomerase